MLALLAAGYATDWTRGLKKGTGIGSPDSANQLPGADGSAGVGTSNAGSNGGSGNNGGSTSTTTNNATTTNNTTTNSSPGGDGGGNGGSTLTDELAQLYNETGIGDNVNDLADIATSLGIAVDCTTDLLTKDCTFSANGQNFSVRSLLGTGLITGILDGI